MAQIVHVIDILTVRKKQIGEKCNAVFSLYNNSQTKECFPVWHEIAWKSVLQKQKSIFILYTRAVETDEFILTFLLILTIWLWCQAFSVSLS